MTQQEFEKINHGIHVWATKSMENDWWNENNWCTRLKNWFNWNFKGYSKTWYDDDEVASSIMSHIGLFDIKTEGDEIRFMTEEEIENGDHLTL